MKPFNAVRSFTVFGQKTESDAVIETVYTDSRLKVKNGLFIALEGEKFDGHDFVSKAEENGAVVLMCSKEVETDLPVIRVDDTRKGLMKLAKSYRSDFDIPVVGITGSAGKTTTKEMTALCLSAAFNVVKTRGNLNNDIGMPLTLFDIDDSTGAAVVEMGMNHLGEISRLTRTLCPTVGIITNIGTAHIENLGSRENILKAKMEILEGMSKGSALILNGDDDLLRDVKNPDYDIKYFSVNNSDAFVYAENIEHDGLSTVFTAVHGNASATVKLPAIGIHNIYNALAAICAGIVLGIDLDDCAGALGDYVPSGMRQKIVNRNDITFIEDCYNANPDSVRAAILSLSQIDGKRKIAVLGDMLELGAFSRDAHFDSGTFLASQGADALFTLGEMSLETANGAKNGEMKEVFSFKSNSELACALLSYIKPGDVVLFKASRGIKLEETIKEVYDKLEKGAS